jgi:hypothetical protein
MRKEAGIYTDIPLDAYVADPCPVPSLSAGIAHTLLTQSPRHAWAKHPRLNPVYVCEESSRMDIGTVAHAILLEGDREKIVIVDAADWRTKAAKEERDEARSVGKCPILVKDMTAINAMVLEAQRFIAQTELADIFLGGKPECTLLWQLGPVWLRSRPDWLTYDQKIIVDFKTTQASAEPSAWARGPMLNFGCDLQAALALRGLKALAGIEDAKFIFLVQETDCPYACSMVGLSPAFLEFAENKLTHALDMWCACTVSNDWPGYPSRIAWVDPPEYAVYRWGEQQMGEEE